MPRKSSPKDHEVVPFTDLDEFREFLGPLADSYSDAQLTRLRDEMRLMAELLLDFYLLKRKGGKL